MKKDIQINFDKTAIVASLCYVTLPIIIFLFGWTAVWVALIGTVILCLLAVGLYRSIEFNEEFLALSSKWKFWVPVFILVIIWTALSGIGGYSYQNDDFWARNPIYRDLSTYSWPVYYDLSKEPDFVQEMCGNSTVAFSYYFTWWLPASLISKLFGLEETFRNYVLLVWSVIGLFLCAYLICRRIRKTSWGIIAVFIGFSGLDAIPYLFSVNNPSKFIWIYHIEWWADLFQYSSNTTQLFWVFNQSIPIWILIGLLLQLKNNKYLGGLVALSFAYSPWATLGMVPYAIAGSLKKKNEIKSNLNPVNILSALFMMVVFGLFYGSSTGSSGFYGTIFGYYPERIAEILFKYVLFIVFEFGIYYLLLGKSASKKEYIIVTLAELFIIPLIYIIDTDFVMRSTIMPLFMTMIYILEFIYGKSDEKALKIRKKILIAALCIGALTPLAEINRSVLVTYNYGVVTNEKVGSLGYFNENIPIYIQWTRDQYFVYDYEDSAFYRFIGKH
ncbi:MAG: hypothetical protein K5871_01900 [Lachnospiraceae bacterium]|nr:hypothetical protein [Lachnospiraceae bacterium]